MINLCELIGEVVLDLVAVLLCVCDLIGGLVLFIFDVIVLIVLYIRIIKAHRDAYIRNSVIAFLQGCSFYCKDEPNYCLTLA